MRRLVAKWVGVGRSGPAMRRLCGEVDGSRAESACHVFPQCVCHSGQPHVHANAHANAHAHSGQPH
eukprot:363372-Chlamydomonas_euryale.AAC.1